MDEQIVKLSDITHEEILHEHRKKEDTWVKHLVDLIELGEFDFEKNKLLVQPVKNYGEAAADALLLVGGVHRIEALKQSGIEDAAVKQAYDNVLNWDLEQTKVDLLVAAHRDNEHGRNNKSSETKELARKLAETYNITQDGLGAMIGRPQRTVSDWTSDIYASKTAGRNGRIIKLSRLGWTQQAIADREGITDRQVRTIGSSSDFAKISGFLSQGWTLEKIAELYSIDIPTTLSVIMQDMSDQERFKELGWGLRAWDDWRFNDCDDRFGRDWPGRIPAQLVAHALFYFTNEGDLVFDPMGGGGVTPDTCLAFGRKCLAYDASTDSPFTIQPHAWELGSMTWPTKKKASLVFFDPPYFDKMKGDYEKTTDGNAVPISSMERDDYLQFFYEFFCLAKDNIAKGGRIAFLNATWRDFQGKSAMEENGRNGIMIHHYAKVLEDAGWLVTHEIHTDMSTQRFNAGVVSAMQKKRIMGVVTRSLLVAGVF